MSATRTEGTPRSAATIDSGALSAQACADALAGVAAATFDCVQSNLAVLGELVHGPGAAARLGSQLVLRSRPLGNGLHTFDPEPEAEVSRSAALLGLAAVEDCRAVPAADLTDTVTAAGGVWYAIGDAYSMPWLPYFEHAHMPHSFLLGATVGSPTALVVDAYDNQTEWGPAEPGSWQFPWSQLEFPVRLWRWRATAPVIPDRPTVERHGTEAYLAAFRAHSDRAEAWEQLAVDSWLLARWHRQHALACATAGPADAADTAGSIAERWQQLASEVFLGLRRVRRNRPEPAGTIAETERLLTLP